MFPSKNGEKAQNFTRNSKENPTTLRPPPRAPPARPRAARAKRPPSVQEELKGFLSEPLDPAVLVL